MSSSEWLRLIQWRRFAVDVIVAAATFAVAVATVSAADVVGVLTLSGALVALGLLIEPGAGGAPPARDAARPRWRLRST